MRLGVRELQNRSIARLRLDALYHIDHAAQRRLWQGREKPRMPQHGFFHQSIAGTDRNAVSAGDTTRLSNCGAAIPQHAGMRILPVDRKGFIHLHVLAGFDTSAAKNALLRVVAVEGVRMILFVGLGMIRNRLMFDAQQSFRVVNSTVSVIVVAYGAVENVRSENPIKRLSLRSSGLL